MSWIIERVHDWYEFGNSVVEIIVVLSIFLDKHLGKFYYHIFCFSIYLS